MQTQGKITEFRGEHYFLSNFFSAPVVFEGIRYENNEAAFQAQKQPERASEFSSLPPNEAKRLGRRVKLRPDWEVVKQDVMLGVVRAKFTQNAKLREKLIQTGDAELIEGNTWGDTYWGVCRGTGRNELGKILMMVRDDLKKCNDAETRIGGVKL
ncbi:NADAR family protein [Metabacillus sp. SLBN-84]